MVRSIIVAVSVMLLASCAERQAAPAYNPPPGPFTAIPVPTTAYFDPMPPIVQEASVASCNARPERAFQIPVGPRDLDVVLLDRAILFHTNRARCAAGLSALVPDPGLRTVATNHSIDMVRLRFFGHTSPVGGKTTVSDRLDRRGVPYRGAAENLATTKRLAIASGQPVYPVPNRRCAFSLTPNGPVLPVRTYDATARNLVDRWIASPGHRRNLMDPTYTRHGASGAIDADARLCESINATQLFAS